jgi:tetratricopeptide (TPR) repeat protein
MNTISPSSTTTTTTNMSSAEMLFNDHLRGSATHRMVTSASSNKGNLHNNGNLVVGGMNGSVLTYGSGAARTSNNAKEDESANHACAVDPALFRQVQGSSDPEDLNNSGNEYYRRGFFSEALVFYDRATMLCPSNASYRSSKGAALSGLGRLAEAVYEWEESIRLEPSCCGRAHQRVVSLYIRLAYMYVSI